MNESAPRTRRVDAGGLLLPLALAVVCLLPRLAGAAGAAQDLCEPCFSIPHFTLDSTAETQVAAGSFSAIVTVGGMEATLTANDFGEYSVATGGLFSYYLAEPLPPLLTATDGDHIDRVALTWEIVDDEAGPPVTEDEVLVYRNGAVLTSLPIDQTQFQDFNVFPGEEYEYAVVPSNSLGASQQEIDFGFLNPNGTVVGQIETPSGNPVPDVKVVLTPNLGLSALLEGEDYVYFPSVLTGLEAGYTVEGWFRSFDNSEQTLFAVTDSATTRPFMRLQLTGGGRLSWEHRGATAAQSDRVTTPVSFTDSEWHHFAAVLADSNMSMTLYVDGRIAAHGTASELIGAQRAQAVLGKLGPIQHDQHYQGRLDDRGCGTSREAGLRCAGTWTAPWRVMRRA